MLNVIANDIKHAAVVSNLIMCIYITLIWAWSWKHTANTGTFQRKPGVGRQFKVEFSNWDYHYKCFNITIVAEEKRKRVTRLIIGTNQFFFLKSIDAVHKVGALKQKETSVDTVSISETFGQNIVYKNKPFLFNWFFWSSLEK